MFTVTKGTQGAYTAYFLADTDACTTAVIVPEKGGMATSFCKNGAEYLWLREPNFSLPERPRCAVPVLFPVCGRCENGENIFDGKAYPMDIHGFAHSMPWQVVGQDTTDGASLTIQLKDSDATHIFYPFAFCVTLTYVLKGGVLSVLQQYQNAGDVSMPFSFGFHPYFAISDVRNLVWDVRAKSQMNDDFTSFTAAPARVDFPYDPDQVTRYYAGVESPMSFTDTQLNHTVTVHFDAHSTNAVLWSQCELGFVCMEPWNGFPNSLQTKQHETLAAGESLHAVMSIEIS
ncbi:MAG: aldose epimerase [Ruthenibacterium sp.]